MKRIIAVFTLFTVIQFFGCKNKSVDPENNTIEMTDIAGLYLGQSLPSTEVARFAPDIFTEELHAPPIFSPAGDEVYWSDMSPYPSGIFCMKLIDGFWTEPSLASFSHGQRSDSPFISSDGNTLVYLSERIDTGGEDIWIVDNIDGEWGTPEMFGPEVNQFNPHWQASMADNQNLYFGANGDVYFSAYINGAYTTAENLGTMINTDVVEGCPFIARDESYLIFDRTMSNRYADLFISFKQDDGSWGDAVNMVELNRTYHELYANVSPDGRFIMFLSNSDGRGLLPYWVDASVIEDYRGN